QPRFKNPLDFGQSCLGQGGNLAGTTCTFPNGAKLTLDPNSGCPMAPSGQDAAGGGGVAKAGVGTMAIVGAGLAALLLLR
ncbi:MAG: hypothetical protein JRD89_20225, partial [Deltaproteobacteria bacterium]|nr:hypothetical protein [Deltaproteobacteria bacterium]